MNPSADGWIKKLLKDVSTNETYLQLPLITFYHELKLSGYLYGNNVSVIHSVFDKADWTDEELCKVNHVLALLYVHQSCPSETNFIESVIQFYNAIEAYKESFIQGLLGKKKSSILLESIIHKRIYIDDNLITKNFNYFITNALLFIDVLAYKNYLTSNSISHSYFENMELTIETIALNVFEVKTNRTEYDQSLIKLFESSLRYQSTEKKSYTDVIKNAKSPLEKYYVIDIACMASWTDTEIDHKEYEFLYTLADDLSIQRAVVGESVSDIKLFFSSNKDQISLLTKRNLAQSFYDNSSKMVIKLITRNSKRLLNEFRESKELMVLLTKSTKRQLTDEEHKKVNEQLLDIIKSIPSLAIFLLPGGAILLPLFIKFIPKLLPSAFDENRIDD
ncbi:MAG: LETM1-related biofilm-associated protein [Aquaticitalea sp.]